ncbi:hypothetical protein BDZ91DRAFT_172033 [Kalaharituber pfeilii]|nr:hypothetical protein BDZ91DRAFT_172033 [Kalaharituber pfeilii]
MSDVANIFDIKLASLYKKRAGIACCSVRTVILHLTLSAYGFIHCMIAYPVMSNHQGAAEIRNSKLLSPPKAQAIKRQALGSCTPRSKFS